MSSYQPPKQTKSIRCLFAGCDYVANVFDDLTRHKEMQKNGETFECPYESCPCIQWESAVNSANPVKIRGQWGTHKARPFHRKDNLVEHLRIVHDEKSLYGPSQTATFPAASFLSIQEHFASTRTLVSNVAKCRSKIHVA